MPGKKKPGPPKRAKRGRPQLENETILVRYGHMDVGHLGRQIALCKRIKGYYGLSLFGENDHSAEAICRIVRFLNGWMRLATVGTLS